jgi:para-aminobenzoate synthetase/4-amino-4-deoxychorismate lyase
MEILRELETEPRGVYTGAIGHVRPDGDARFNVAIRTAVVDQRAGRVHFGVGSGIVWDSDADAEYEECLLKGSVLNRPPIRFELLETMRWAPDDGFLLLERHLDRLSASAEYFDFAFGHDRVVTALRDAVATATAPLRVRLLLSKDGAVHVAHQPLVTMPLPLTIRLALEPIDMNDIFFFHKTTRRLAYEGARIPGCDDTVLWNRNGYVTEATMANVIVDLGGKLFTPPVECGLLAGTFRAELLANGSVSERIVTVDEFRAARRWWLVNSVHRQREAVLR